ARDATRGDFDAWAREWALEPATQSQYLDKLGRKRLDWLRSRSDPDSWHADSSAHPVDEERAVSQAETAAALGAREIEARVAALGAHAVLAGAGLANLSAWVGVSRARAAGSSVCLTAELGMWGYTPTPADPYIFNHRVFPRTPMLTDCTRILGMVVGGPGTTTIGCLGAAQLDRLGNINSTRIPDGPFLVGSGGGNDVASRAEECVVVTSAARHRLLEAVGYVTSPGASVQTAVTDKGVLRKREGELCLSAVPEGPSSLEARVRDARDSCGWDLRVDRDVEELPGVTLDEAVALRRYDPEGLFLGS
ncbi:MAG: CoA-transferase, partial [Thermoplasmata archaeon]